MAFKVWEILVAGLILAFNHGAIGLVQERKLSYCSVDDTLPRKWSHGSAIVCSLLDLRTDHLDCYIAIDRVTCLSRLMRGKIDFMIAEPEDLMILGMKYSSGVLVTHELKMRPGETIEDSQSNSLVALIRNDNGNISSRKGQRFCSLGFEQGLFTRDHGKYFESRLFERVCDTNQTLVEDRIASLSSFFGPTCISGPWTNEYELNAKLKKKYPHLCSQCGNSSTCSTNDKYFGKSGSVRCLREGKADMVWTSLDVVRSHFKGPEDEKKYSFLCEDNTTRNLTSEPCIWIKEPGRTIIARRDAAEKLNKFINDEENNSDIWKLFYQKPVSIESPKTPTDYLEEKFPNYYSSIDLARCNPDRKVKWCVASSLEAEKCEWLAFAAKSRGIEPSIACVEKEIREDCLESVKSGESDIFAAEPEEDVEAEKRGLKKIVHVVTNRDIRNDNISVAVVRKFTNFTSLEGLRNRKACFYSYKGFGWNSFIYAMRKLTGNNDWYSKDKEMVSEFFSESCIAELHEKREKRKEFPENLYSLCTHNGHAKRSSPSKSGVSGYSRQPRNPAIIERFPGLVERFVVSETEELEREEEAMRNCLKHNDADVAFVNQSSLLKIYSDMAGSYFEVLCLNESRVDSNDIGQCYSARTEIGSLMIRKDVTKVREDDIYLMLMDIDKIFGVSHRIISKLISLYGHFDGRSGIIFPDRGQYLDRRDCSFRCNLDYDHILKDISTYHQFPYRAKTTKASTVMMLIFHIFSIVFGVVFLFCFCTLYSRNTYRF